MTEHINQAFPAAYINICEATKTSDFTMASDVLTCTLLRTLACAKPSGKFLELGTGTGLSTSWILDGMDNNSTLISIDNDPLFLDIAKEFLPNDVRLNLISTDAGEWISMNKHQRFDFIFADTWHGKYLLLDEILTMINEGGLYIIDDMLPQDNWPEGHDEKAFNLISGLESRKDLILTKQLWATGIIIAAKRKPLDKALHY